MTASASDKSSPFCTCGGGTGRSLSGLVGLSPFFLGDPGACDLQWQKVRDVSVWMSFTMDS